MAAACALTTRIPGKLRKPPENCVPGQRNSATWCRCCGAGRGNIGVLLCPEADFPSIPGLPVRFHIFFAAAQEDVGMPVYSCLCSGTRDQPAGCAADSNIQEYCLFAHLRPLGALWCTIVYGLCIDFLSAGCIVCRMKVQGDLHTLQPLAALLLGEVAEKGPKVAPGMPKATWESPFAKMFLPRSRKIRCLEVNRP